MACVGDSFTAGWGVEDPDDVFPQRLGALLEERAPGRFATLNLGIVGGQTDHEAALLERTERAGLYERVILAST